MSIVKRRMSRVIDLKYSDHYGRSNCLIDSTCLASWYYHATVEIFSATVKHVRPHLRSVQIKFGKQEKSHFSRPSTLEAIKPRERLGRWSHGHAITNPVRSPTDCSRQNESIKSVIVDIRIEFDYKENVPANTTVYCLIIYDRVVIV